MVDIFKNKSNNSRIAKNTGMLYVRMLLTMAVSLYTVRIVLHALGVIDYGIYNVVGGVVTSFSFFSVTMANASQRFFAYEIGRNDMVQLKRTFSMTLIIYCIISLLILIIAETVGLWFLNHKMNISLNRISAANWIYQFAIFSFMLTMFQVPYDAIVIARERMNIFAYLSILEVLLKLLIVYLLVLIPFDKLKTYSVLIFLVTLIITTFYKMYCLMHFKESRFRYYWDKKLFREITSYSGWNLFGALAKITNNEGINIVLNLFFGPVVNAGRGIAYQVSVAINGFVQNFMTAARPQITIYFAQGEIQKMLNLVFQSSKFSFFLLLTISMPVLLETHFIFHLWLKNVPPYVVLFSRIIILTALVDTLSYSLMAAFQATGRVKLYQIVVGGTIMMNVPISYIFFKLGYPPETCLIVVFITSIICLFIRLLLLKRIIILSINSFLKKVMLPVIAVSVLAFLIPLIIKKYMFENFQSFILVSGVSVFSCLIFIGLIGINKHERFFLFKTINKFRSKFVI